MRFVSGFRKVKQILQSDSFYTLRIKGLLEILEAFQRVSATNMNTGCYNIELCPEA